jgi:RNA polymerase sigma-70 factor (ECF subfamily)
VVAAVTVNLALNHRSRRKTALPLLDGQVAPDPGPEAQAIRSDEAARVHRALQALQPGHRAAVVLRDLEGVGYREIAEMLEVPEGTVKGWAHRGRERLKELLS